MVQRTSTIIILLFWADNQQFVYLVYIFQINDNIIVASIYQTFFSLLFLRYKRIVKFLVLSKISFIRSYTNYCCFISYSGLGFSRNFIVLTRLCSNSLDKLWAASISMLESPIQMRFVTSWIKVELHSYLWFWGWSWMPRFSIWRSLQGTLLQTSISLRWFWWN